MSTVEWLYVIRVLAVVAGLGVAFSNFRYVLKCRQRSWKLGYRLFIGFCGLYFSVIYLAVLLGSTAYPLKSGLMTIGGVVMLLMLNIADVIIDTRECK